MGSNVSGWHKGILHSLGRWLAPHQVLSGLMVTRVDQGTKYILSGQIIQLVLAVLICTSHKFTTSAFLLLWLTGKRFTVGMRSERERESYNSTGKLPVEDWYPWSIYWAVELALLHCRCRGKYISVFSSIGGHTRYCNLYCTGACVKPRTF